MSRRGILSNTHGYREQIWAIVSIVFLDRTSSHTPHVRAKAGMQLLQTEPDSLWHGMF